MMINTFIDELEAQKFIQSKDSKWLQKKAAFDNSLLERVRKAVAGESVTWTYEEV